MINVLAIVGSRTFNNYTFMKNVLKGFKFLKIVSGGAIGADNLAKKYAQENNIPITEFLPDWKTHGKSAGFIRNKLIIDRCDEVIAFWDGKSHGTKNSIDLAKNANKPFHVFWKE